MNNFKKSIALSLAAATVFACTSCGKSSKANPADSETTIAETTTVSETTVSESQTAAETTIASTTKASSTDEKAKLLVATEADKANFNKFMSYLLSCRSDYVRIEEGSYFNTYNCESRNGFMSGFLNLIGTSDDTTIEFLAKMYGWNVNDFLVRTTSSDVKDPLKKFGGQPFNKFNGEKFDMLLKEVFNVQPNHNYVMTSEASENSFELETLAYYNNGSYYAPYGHGGSDTAEITINSMTQQADGKYSINITEKLIDGLAEETLYTTKLNVEAALKTINGSRVWSIYNFFAAE